MLFKHCIQNSNDSKTRIYKEIIGNSSKTVDNQFLAVLQYLLNTFQYTMIGLRVLISNLNEDAGNHLELVITDYLQELHKDEDIPFKSVIEKLVSNFLQMEDYGGRRSSLFSKKILIQNERGRTLNRK